MTSGEHGANEQFDTRELQLAEVKCCSCGKCYICTPDQDYYNSDGQRDEDGVFIDGQCEPCLLDGAGFRRLGFVIPPPVL